MSSSNLGRPTISVAEAMARLGLSRATVIRYVKKGHLRGFQTNPGQPNSWWKVYAHSVDEFLAQREGVSQ